MARKNQIEQKLDRILRDAVFSPKNSRLIVFVCEFLFPGQEASSLVTPDTAQDRPETGVIVAAPTRSEYIQGDRVLFGKYSSYNLPGNELVCITEQDVISTLPLDLPIKEEIDLDAETKAAARAGGRIVVPNTVAVDPRLIGAAKG